MPETEQVQVDADDDDAMVRYQTSTFYYMGINNTDMLQVGYRAATLYAFCAGMIFRSVDVPQGAYISNAYLTLTAFNDDSGTTVNTKIRAYDADDITGDLSTSAEWDAMFPSNLTTAEVQWDSIASWTQYNEYNSPDISSVIQEIIDRPGWSSGNDMCIFWDDYDERSSASDFARRRCVSHNFILHEDEAAVLNIEYQYKGQIIKVQIH